MKEMIDKKEIGILKISKIEGDKVELEGKSPIPKTVGDILLKVNPKEGDSKGEETEETPTEETPTEENPKETK